MHLNLYTHLAVVEKALRQQPLSVAERKVARHLAEYARASKDSVLLQAAFGDA